MTDATTNARSPRQDDWMNDDAYDDLSWLPDDDGDDDYLDPAEAARRDAAAMQRALGVDDVYGYHVEDRRFDEGDDPSGDVVALHDAAPAPALQEPAYPYLDGHRYSGCRGEACPRQRCWTGGPTPRLASRLQQFSQASETLYVPGAPCLGCLHARSEEVTLPVALDRRPKPDHAPSPSSRRKNAASTFGAERKNADSVSGIVCGDADSVSGAERGDTMSTSASEHLEVGGDGAAATVERVICARGLWEHAVSPAAFAARRVPLVAALQIDLDGHVECPAFEPRAETHPVIEAHLAHRRQRDRSRRAR